MAEFSINGMFLLFEVLCFGFKNIGTNVCGFKSNSGNQVLCICICNLCPFF